MVLMSFLLACSFKKTDLLTVAPHDVYTVSSLDQLDVLSSVALPSSLENQIQEALVLRGIRPTRLEQPSNYTTLRNSNQRLLLFSQRPLLLIESKAQFFSQLEGRFRWTVDVAIHLQAKDGTTFSKVFSVPVFHQFHHQRETEAIEAAQSQILQELNLLLDDYIRGYSP